MFSVCESRCFVQFDQRVEVCSLLFISQITRMTVSLFGWRFIFA